jgi:DNA polymerase III alpha subunit
MQFISFEDETAIFETVFFPKTYTRYSRRLTHHRPYILTGKVDSEFGVVSLNVNGIEVVGEQPEADTPSAVPGASDAPIASVASKRSTQSACGDGHVAERGA